MKSEIKLEVEGGSSWLISVTEGDTMSLLAAMSDKTNTGKLYATVLAPEVEFRAPMKPSHESDVSVTHHHHTLREDGLSPDRVRKALDGPSQRCTTHGCYNV